MRPLGWHASIVVVRVVGDVGCLGPAWRLPWLGWPFRPALFAVSVRGREIEIYSVVLRATRSQRKCSAATAEAMNNHDAPTQNVR